ncbi:hypothetical protein EV214_12634 [Marinisporobacter balticus]|uniref:Uncharacterized protein n=1 Tax=Marinisporobacter balticus TaxID=2018667 RepID=A0A4R2KC29_9FIRM|nr:hypothetical protein EV214_12634 [Marinisporobacter balticus]
MKKREDGLKNGKVYNQTQSRYTIGYSLFSAVYTNPKKRGRCKECILFKQSREE